MKTTGTRYTPEQIRAYIESDGSHCPKCTSHNIMTTGQEINNASVSCIDCGESWIENNKLVGINGQELPPAHLFVFVSGGAVTGITDEQGKEGHDEIHLVDYDNKDGGACPACGAEAFFDEDGGTFTPCDECGFDMEAGGDDENARAITAIMSLERGA